MSRNSKAHYPQIKHCEILIKLVLFKIINQTWKHKILIYWQTGLRGREQNTTTYLCEDYVKLPTFELTTQSRHWKWLMSPGFSSRPSKYQRKYGCLTPSVCPLSDALCSHVFYLTLQFINWTLEGGHAFHDRVHRVWTQLTSKWTATAHKRTPRGRQLSHFLGDIMHSNKQIVSQ